MSDERRNQRRVPVLVDVLWEGITRKHEARTSDLSIGGCFVDTVGQVAEGEIINLKLLLPAGEWIHVESEVTYTYPTIGFGVRFTKLSDANRKKIELLINAESYRQDNRQ